MDYSKVNNALSGWQGSSSRRDREQAELGQAMQLMQMNQAVQEDRQAKEQQLDQWMQVIQQQANQIAVRNEDKDIVQGLYDQEKTTFLAELEKAGNDPVKFMNSGGRKIMQNFYNNIVNSDEVGRIRSNTAEVQKYFETLEGNDGKNAHLLSHQTRRDFNAFMDGHIDSFESVQLAGWSEPSKEDVEGAPSKVKAYLATDNNYQIFKNNYAIEYGLPSDAVVDGSISEQQLEAYVAQYVGGGNPQAALSTTNTGQGGVVNKSYGARLNKQFRKFKRKTISTDVIGGNSAEYSLALKDFDSGRFVEGQGPIETDVIGHRGFEGDELIFAQMQFGENAVPDLDSDTYIDNVISDGTMYDEDGELLPSGFEIGSIQPQGVYLGYKVKTKDGYRLVKHDDLEETPQDAEHVLIQEYQDDDWFTGKERYYIEVDTENQTKMAMLSKQKGIDTSLGRYTAEVGPEGVVEQQSVPVINFNSTIEEIQPQIHNYDVPLSRTMAQIGIKDQNVVAKSLLMALASSGGDIQAGIGGLVQMFNPETAPQLNKALVEGDSQTFFDLYLQRLVDGGYDQQQAMQQLMAVDQLRDRIQKAYNI